MAKETNHEYDDALDHIRTEIQLHLRKYRRRVQKEAELELDRLESAHAVAQLDASEEEKEDFDYEHAAEMAVRSATARWLRGQPQRALDA